MEMTIQNNAVIASNGSVFAKRYQERSKELIELMKFLSATPKIVLDDATADMCELHAL